MNNFKNISLLPKWGEVERARRATTKFLISHKLSEDVVNSMTMIISELTENAIKYGNYKKSKDPVLLIKYKILKS